MEQLSPKADTSKVDPPDRSAATVGSPGDGPIDDPTDCAENEYVTDAEQDMTISKITDRLAVRFPATSRQRIECIVGEEYQALESGRIRTYVPTLVENSARTRLHREQAESISAGQPSLPGRQAQLLSDES